jgi:peptide/nickel transport system substrate-binding protein
MPPFDDVRVRRAVNLAVDRGLAVRSSGGEERAAASCQLLPPSFPGYRRYCPYEHDLRTARRLVAAAGADGTVVVWTSAWGEPAVRPVVSALRTLGFRVRLTLLPDDTYFDRLHTAGENVQAGFYGWMPNYVSAADFVVPFTCREARSGSANLSRFCDPGVERLAARARDLRATDQAAANAVWARVDRAITDLAPFVPLVNPRAAYFVSARVGNYQVNPTWGVILEQLWVR